MRARAATARRLFPLMVRYSYHEQSDNIRGVFLRSPYENLRASGPERLLHRSAHTTGCVITVGGGAEGFPR